MQPKVRAGPVPGPGLLSVIVVGKYADHLPLYRREDVFARGGVEISCGTLCRWAAESAKLLKPLYQLMVRQIITSRAIHTDDTTVPVLDAKLPHTRTARFWTYVCVWPMRLRVFDYTQSRSRDGPARFLRGQKWVLA
jgi:transposase